MALALLGCVDRVQRLVGRHIGRQASSLSLSSAQLNRPPNPRSYTHTNQHAHAALHCIEYESLFSSSKATAATTTNEQLDGTWRLAFNSGGAFPLKGARQDRWGYLKDDVEVGIVWVAGGSTYL